MSTDDHPVHQHPATEPPIRAAAVPDDAAVDGETVAARTVRVMDVDVEVLAQVHSVAQRHARTRGASVLDAQDVAQETVVRFLRLPALPGNVAAWATTVAGRLVIDLHRRATVDAGDGKHRVDRFEHRDLRDGPGPVSFATPSMNVVARDETATVLAVLTDREREVLLTSLAYPPDQAAERLGLASPAVLATMVSRARGKLVAAFPPGSAARRSLFDHPSLYR